MPNADQKRDEYKPEVLLFLNDYCYQRGTVRARKLYPAYIDWARTRPVKRIAGKVNFSEIVRERYPVEGYGNNRVYVGISLPD